MMFVIMCYDVNRKNDAKVLKTAKKYLHHVQNSVLEGYITESSLQKLRREMEAVINADTEQMTIYCMADANALTKQQFGQCGRTFDGFL